MNTDPKNPDQQPAPIADSEGRPAQQPTDEPHAEEKSSDSFDHKRTHNPPKE